MAEFMNRKSRQLHLYLGLPTKVSRSRSLGSTVAARKLGSLLSSPSRRKPTFFRLRSDTSVTEELAENVSRRCASKAPISAKIDLTLPDIVLPSFPPVLRRRANVSSSRASPGQKKSRPQFRPLLLGMGTLRQKPEMKARAYCDAKYVGLFSLRSAKANFSFLIKRSRSIFLASHRTAAAVASKGSGKRW